MEKKIIKKHRLVVDRLFLNGFNQTKAYKEVYMITNDNYAKVGASRLMDRPEVKAYFNHRMEEYRATLDIDKDKMLDRLMELDNLFIEMTLLANKETLTNDEEARLTRLSTILKGADANKARDMINKLQGNYAADKQEITFREQPLFGSDDKTEDNEEK